MAETLRIEIPIETIDNTDPELSNVTKNFEKMEKAADGANSAAKKANTTVTQFDKQAQKTEKSLAGWAKERYEILLEAKEKISPVLSTLGNGLRSFAGKTWNVTMRAVDLVTSPVRGIINLLKNPIFQVGAAIGVSISLKDTIDTYADFEATMSRVKALSSATDGQMQKLTHTAKEMGAKTKFSGTESAEAFTYMAQAGWEVNDMVDGIGGIMSLAAADGLDLAATTDIVSNALTAFGLKANESARFADVLAVASSATNTDVSGLGEAFKYVAPIAGAMKYSIEDVSLALGLMSNNAVKGSMAGTSLKTSLANLAAPTDNMAAAMSKYKISLTDSSGNMKSLKGLLDNLRSSLGGLSETEQTAAASTIFGKEAMAGMLGIINTTADDYKKLTDEILDSEGAADRMANTMQDNLAGAFEQLGGAVETVQLTLGERMKPYLLSLTKWMESNMPAIEDMANDLFDTIDRKADKLQDKIADMVSTDAWQNADTFGKIKIAWDEMIAEPFAEWWSSTGKVKFAGFAQDIGQGIGAGLKVGIMTLLGIDLGETLDEGVSIGASFAEGFSEGFDFEAVSGKLWAGFGNMFSSAAKLLPGGKSADLSSVLSAVILGKIATPFISLGKGATKVGKGLLGTNPATGTSLAGSFLGSAAAGSGLLGKSAMLAINLGAGNLAGGASMSAGALSAVGMGAGAGALVGGATLVSSALDAYRAIKSDDKEESKAYGESSAWKAGGVAAGAAAGAALGSVIPGLGTAVGALVGAGVGGIAGWIKGNKVKEEYQENVEEMQKEAEKAQKAFAATGLSIEDITFQNEALQAAMNDSEVSAAEFAQMFQEECANVAKKAFGDITLSLAEIKQVASEITFADQAEELSVFSQAVSDTDSALSNLQSSAAALKKENWKVGLGMELSETAKDSYKTAIKNYTDNAQTYIDDNHYEATVALKLLTGKDTDTGGLDNYYGGLKEQMESLSSQLTEKMNIALEDSVIMLDESAEIESLQEQISEITGKLASAKTEAQMQTLKVKYNGAALDMDSFNALQEELQANVESASEQYESALTLTLTNLNLQLSDGAITQEEYNTAVQEATDGYYAQIDKINARVSSFNLESIATAWDSELVNIMPDIKGTTEEKLAKALNDALLAHPDVATWSTADVISWMGLDKLNIDTAKQTTIAAELIQTALAVPEGTKEQIIQNFKDQVPTREELLAGINWNPFADGNLISTGVPSFDFGSVMEQYGPISNEYYGQLLTQWQTAGTSMASSMNTGVTSSLLAGSSLYRTSAETAVSSAFANPFSVTAAINVTPRYSGLNSLMLPTLPASGHAAGGYVGSPELSWLAEEGYGEFVIPTNPSRRARALDLYEQAGAALGVSAHADGGFVGGSNLSDKATGYNFFTEANRNAPLAYNETTEGSYNEETASTYEPVSPEAGTAGWGTPVQVSVQMSPEFVIPRGETQSEEDIMQVIRRHMKEMADELGGEIAGKLQEVFSNMPLKEA